MYTIFLILLVRILADLAMAVFVPCVFKPVLAADSSCPLLGRDWLINENALDNRWGSSVALAICFRCGLVRQVEG